jgi:HAD superfamily hydrolase (TIGR01509 family)
MNLGAIFDWDGVIIDSAKQHKESWERLAAEEKRPLPPDHFKQSFGRKNEAIIPELFGWTRDPAEIRRMSLRKEALYRELVVEQGTAPLPGVREFLQRLSEAGVPCAVGSSTHRANIDTHFRITGIAPFFSAIVTAEDVTVGKPDPQVFLLAAARIAREPRRCLVFEDAFVGLQAARAGGMKTVAVASTNPAASLAPWADRVVNRLDELSIAELQAIVGY